MVNHMLIQCQPLEKAYAVLAVRQFVADNGAAVIPHCPRHNPRHVTWLHKQVDDTVEIIIYS